MILLSCPSIVFGEADCKVTNLFLMSKKNKPFILCATQF